MKKGLVCGILLVVLFSATALDTVLSEAEQNRENIITEFNSWEGNKQLLIGYNEINIGITIDKIVVRRYHLLIDDGTLKEINYGNIPTADFYVSAPLSITKEWIAGPKTDWEQDYNKLQFSDPLLKYGYKKKIEGIYANTDNIQK